MPTNFPNGVLSRGVPTESGIPLTGGDVFHVDSGHVNASDSSAGTNPNHPMATLDAAVGRCAANNGDVILLYPGHNENIGNAQISLDVAGISVIGMGNGPDRPRFDFDHANASIDIGANGITVKNIVLLPSLTAILIGIDVEASVTDTVLENIEAIPGEDGAGADEFVTAIETKAGCTRTVIKGFLYSHHASAAHAAQAIHINGISDRVLIENFWIEISGAAAVAGILFTGVSTRSLISNGVITADAEEGISSDGANTGSIRDVDIFSNLGTVAAATVATGMAHFRVSYVEVANESGAVVKTASAND